MNKYFFVAFKSYYEKKTRRWRWSYSDLLMQYRTDRRSID